MDADGLFRHVMLTAYICTYCTLCKIEDRHNNMPGPLRCAPWTQLPPCVVLIRSMGGMATVLFRMHLHPQRDSHT